MRVAVVFAPASGRDALAAMARSMADALAERGWTADVAEARAGDAHRLTGYDYIIVGTEPVGLRGKVPPRLHDFLSQAGMLQGARSMAFVRKRSFASGRSLRRLMAVMESEGMIVNAAEILGSAEEAAKAARNAPIERQ